MARGLFAVLEDELSGEIVPENTEQQERVEELEAQVAEGEVTEAEGEVEELVEAVEEAIDAVEEVEEIAEVAEGSVEAGDGLTEEAAEIAEVAVESICNRLGYKPAKRIIPAMESFGATSSRLDATKYALEGFKETVKKIWEGIKAFFNNLWESIKTLWKKLTDAAYRYKARAEKQAKKIKELTDANAVAKDGNKVNAGKYCEAFNEKNVSNLVTKIPQQLQSDTLYLKELGAINDKLIKLGTDGTKEEMKIDINTSDFKFIEKYGQVMSFGYTFAISDAKGIEVTQAGKVAGTEGEIDTVDLSKLSAIVEKVIDACVNFEKAKSGFAKAENVVKTIVKAADSLAKNSEEGSNDKERAATFRKAGNVFNVMNTKVPTICIKGAGKALDFVADNLSNYGAGK